MRRHAPKINLYRIATTLALTCSVSAHSWIEYAIRIAPNGAMVGELGYPRGYKDRKAPGFSDKVPQMLLPVVGTAAYTGNEIINKFPFTDKPEHPFLQVSPGDHIAITHFENGHVSIPENQPFKPRNRGTIFIYGTSQPKEQEKLFDVHLRWNKDGTGGDKRGVLLATKNYDDGQCFQPNTAAITNERISKLSGDGARQSEELACQSDVKLPDDLKPGSIYTIYWYWDWPNLNPAKIDLEKTKDGSFPWAGSFMRGDKIPNGWTMDVISLNESYSSVIDIKVGEKKLEGFAAKDEPKDRNIYSKAIPDQMKSNFQVQVVGMEGDAAAPASGTVAPTAGATSSGQAPARTSPPTTFVTGGTPGKAPSSAPGQAPSGAPCDSAPAGSSTGVSSSILATGGGSIVTVTQMVTVPATTLLTTVYRTVAAGQNASTQPIDEVTVTITTRVPRQTQPLGTGATGPKIGPDPTVTPFLRRRRSFRYL
ncbi:hypothetical protein QQS21_009930 [Conoideocrella luteorostrata]|uniref:DUF7492 domain-containing protein n=1 Tax=Conoideocrella luteorostrata TaxID=1105319 RepID=A0AAJ0FUN7_9HYPO|nr:hypothetical protein QQS21_009930 [Conoideocrella luteorostrata]